MAKALTNDEKGKILRDQNWRILVSRSNQKYPWIYLGKLMLSQKYPDHFRMENCFNIGYYQEIGLIGIASKGPEKVNIFGDGTIDREISVLMVLDNLSVGIGWFDFLLEKKLL